MMINHVPWKTQLGRRRRAAIGGEQPSAGPPAGRLPKTRPRTGATLHFLGIGFFFPPFSSFLAPHGPQRRRRETAILLLPLLPLLLLLLLLLLMMRMRMTMSMQNERLWRLEGERELQMRQLTSQLLLLEANLRRAPRGPHAPVPPRTRKANNSTLLAPAKHKGTLS